MLKNLLLAILLANGLFVPAFGQVDSVKMFHISTSGRLTSFEGMNINAEFVSLFLYDTILFDNFEAEIVKLRESLSNKYLLLVVSKGESTQRGEFLRRFYQARLRQGKDGNPRLAYAQALQEIKGMYKDLDFKSTL